MLPVGLVRRSLDPGARFENLVAGHLRKACDMWNDAGKGLFALHYVRDKEKREVDFLVTRERKPWLLAECKLAERTPASALRRFAEILHPRSSCRFVGTMPGTTRSNGSRAGAAMWWQRTDSLGLLP